MTMQTDVKSYHNTTSGVAYNGRTRLKGVLMSPSTSVTFNTVCWDKTSKTGTYNVPGNAVCTVTMADHGLSNGNRVFLDFTSGTSQDDAYTVSNATTSTFTVTVASTTTNGNVTMYSSILAEFDSSSGTAYYTLIPGEGILAPNGIYVGIPNASITTTLFYG